MPDKKPASGAELELIRDLAALLHESGLSEIELERGGVRVRIASGTHAATYAPTQIVHQGHPMAALSSPAAGGAGAAAHPGAVLSPMVGTVYLSPEPGAALFAKIGDTVTEGQTLLTVEAMKTFNPIPAPRAGKLVEVLVTNGQPVEFGQPLAIIE